MSILQGAKPFPMFFFKCLLLLIFSGCGYQIGQSDTLLNRFTTISVPYVEGDVDGSLTGSIIKEIVRSGSFTYQRSGGDLLLCIKQIDLREENIGFRYDRKKRGKLLQEIIPVETRLTDVVEVSVVDVSTGCTVLGPVKLSASVDFDHDYYFSRDGVNIFSLGQLIDIDAAYDAVQVPLHQAIAKKISDYISQSW